MNLTLTILAVDLVGWGAVALLHRWAWRIQPGETYASARAAVERGDYPIYPEKGSLRYMRFLITGSWEPQENLAERDAEPARETVTV